MLGYALLGDRYQHLASETGDQLRAVTAMLHQDVTSEFWRLEVHNNVKRTLHYTKQANRTMHQTAVTYYDKQLYIIISPIMLIYGRGVQAIIQRMQTPIYITDDNEERHTQNRFGWEGWFWKQSHQACKCNNETVLRFISFFLVWYRIKSAIGG
jgi:hypothetical protein